MALEDSFAIEMAGSLRAAVDALQARIPDAVLLDINLPDGSGINLFQQLNALKPMPVVVVMTAYGTVETAVKALKEGAADYVVKPFELDRLKRDLGIHLENRSLHRKVDALDREIRKIAPPFVTTGSGRMKDIVEKARMVAPLDLPVLIMGETGTGKEKMARWIHSLSGTQGELVAINCAALPKDIIESELFGYTKGAFSGAVAYKEGLVERANGGTLFLDEIGELPEVVQAKFLRVLEDGVYYKLGDTRERKANFRLISASNRELADTAASFRKDLYYRINGITFDLPPLRDRRDDIPLLVAAFIKEANFAYKKGVRGVSPRAMQHLLSSDWPGNIRELKWCINRGVAIATGEILESADLTLPLPAESEKLPTRIHVDYEVPLDEAVEQLERDHISHALQAAGNNRTEAARLLGISVRMLHYKIKKYDL